MESRGVIRMWLVTALLSGWTSRAAGECPTGCYCGDAEESLDCAHLSSFPTGIPPTIHSFTVMRSDIPEIPTDAFDNLPKLTAVTFLQVTIGTIRQRAFYRIGRGLPDKSLTFLKCNIAKIESGAFEELYDFSSITLSAVNISDSESGAFSKIGNVASFAIDQLSIPVIRSAMFIDFTNVSSLYITGSTFDSIENEAFSNFSHITSLSLSKLAVGTVGNRFLVLKDAVQVSVSECAFESWKHCAFCGISKTTVVHLHKNEIKSSEGDVFSGMSDVETLAIQLNTLPLIVARFFPLDLKALTFSQNKVTTIVCQPPDTDYPSTITYIFYSNELSCDCRLNWMWMNWSQTKAALVLTGGFSCAKADAEKTTSLLEFFAVSVAGNAPPCDGLEAVNVCVDSTSNTSTISSTAAGPAISSTTAEPSISSTTAEPSISSTTAGLSLSSTTAGPNDKSSAAKSQASWMYSIAVFVFIVIAA